MEQILLPTDFSETSYKAAVFALDLFGTEEARFMLLNAYLKTAYHNALVPLSVDTERASTNGLRRIAGRCRKHAGKVRIALRSTYEPLVRAINELDASKHIDFVVVGTQGEGNYGRVGRNSGAVVTGAVPPVIAVPGEWVPVSIKHILFADDGHGITPASMEPLLAIAKRTNARITVMHVGSIQEDKRTKQYLQELSAGFGDRPHSFITVESTGVTGELDRLVKERDVQLVAVLKRTRNFWERMFQGSTSKRLALHTTVPLLVLRET